MPARYQALVGGAGPGALPVPASTPSEATGGACRVLGFPGTLVARTPNTTVFTPADPGYARLRSGNATAHMRPSVYLLAPPYPGVPPVGRTRSRPSPVPATAASRSAVALMRTPPRLGGVTVTSQPRQFIRWPVRGQRGTYA